MKNFPFSIFHFQFLLVTLKHKLLIIKSMNYEKSSILFYGVIVRCFTKLWYHVS